MLDKIMAMIMGSDFVSKRLFSFLLTKFSIVVVPFLAKYGFNVAIDEKALYAVLAALVANTGAYVWAETHRPSVVAAPVAPSKK